MTSTMIKTANIAGGSVRTHRTIEAAARRISRGDGPFGGYVVHEHSCDVDPDVVRERAQQIWEDQQ